MTTLLPEQTIPSAVAPATLLLPASDVFQRRAVRLAELAASHSLGEWLRWLARLSEAQQTACAQLPDSGLRFAEGEAAVLHGEQPALRQAWPEVYRSLFAQLRGTLTAAANIDVLTGDSLATRGAACLALAAGQPDGQPRDVNDVLIAAAMQTVWTHAAQHLQAPAVANIGASETCPCCGSLPVASIVLAGEGKGGLRYLECSLCATRWNAVRARCTQCDADGVVQYLSVKGGNPGQLAETCEHCHGYIKNFFQDKDPHVEPLADDLASLALDVLVGEQGFARGTPNLLLTEGEVSEAHGAIIVA